MKNSKFKISLAKKCPGLVKEWLSKKNLPLTPDNVGSGSDRVVWWKCSKGHEYDAAISKRSSGRGCPYCSGKRVSPENSLSVVAPKIAAQWHPSKNGTLTPDKITKSSGILVWWLCKKGHEWQTTVNSRFSKKQVNCPYCSGRRVTTDNSLSALKPELAKQWDYDKNIGKTPEQFRPRSGQKVWWKCLRGHSWPATIASRTAGANCPSCTGSQSSKLEIAIYAELSALFDDVEWRHKIHKFEIDVYLESASLGIEIDGDYWHKNKLETDKKKNTALAAEGITLIRLRQQGLELITDNDVEFKPSNSNLSSVIKVIKTLVSG